VHVLGTASSNDLVDTVLDNREFTGVEDHADLGVREVKLLVSAASPWELGDLTALHITQENG